jgi:hypothetical protein
MTFESGELKDCADIAENHGPGSLGISSEKFDPRSVGHSSHPNLAPSVTV